MVVWLVGRSIGRSFSRSFSRSVSWLVFSFGWLISQSVIPSARPCSKSIERFCNVSVSCVSTELRQSAVGGEVRMQVGVLLERVLDGNTVSCCVRLL